MRCAKGDFPFPRSAGRRIFIFFRDFGSVIVVRAGFTVGHQYSSGNTSLRSTPGFRRRATKYASFDSCGERGGTMLVWDFLLMLGFGLV